jgi:hypothetical protein
MYVVLKLPAMRIELILLAYETNGLPLTYTNTNTNSIYIQGV